MPFYDYVCDSCGKDMEVYQSMDAPLPTCCGVVMRRIYAGTVVVVKERNPLWLGRMNDIHKAQEQKGERLRFVHPSEIL